MGRQERCRGDSFRYFRPSRFHDWASSLVPVEKTVRAKLVNRDWGSDSIVSLTRRSRLLEVSPEAIAPRFLERGGKRSATLLFLVSFAGIRESTGAQCSRITPPWKAPSSLRFAGAVQNRELGGSESFRESLM
jgi:hypothetical protein